jgi:hypothetical protein
MEKKGRMSPDEWARFESEAEASIQRLRDLEARGRAELEAKRRAEQERAARRKRFFLFR